MLLLAAAALGTLTYVSVITHRIDQTIDQLRSTRATEFYALYPPLHRNQQFAPADLRTFLADQGFIEEKKAPDDLAPGEYTENVSGSRHVITLLRPAFAGAGHASDRQKTRLTFDESGGLETLIDIQEADSNHALDTFESFPKKVAVYFAGRLRTQSAVQLSDIPVSVRLAVMAIEDVHFLEHIGVSFRGTLRALWKDLRERRFVEGGSTITQQLMKNLFFSREKSIPRKVKEAIFAFVIETRHSKESILEAYLNEVYMGQSGPHEIHGVSEGARYYFNRPVSELSLAQSATLAAIIQAPNAQDPHRFPDRTLKRRNLVLKKMLDAEFILPSEYDAAKDEPLGVTPSGRSLTDVDYDIELVLQQLPSDIRRRLESERFTIYVTLNPYLQADASQALAANIDRLAKISPEIRRREAKGIHLQGAVISIDPRNCSVLALQGGRSFRQTQFNRVLQSKRQPGSLFKPFVYLTAFQSKAFDPPFSALTPIDDSPFDWKYQGQVWTPRNYDNRFRGTVTAFQALENSLNVPTARVAEKVGVDAIRDTLQRAGIRSPIPAVPSISLGSADVTPFELAQAYTSLADLGQSCDLRAFQQVFDENGNLINETKPELHTVFPPVAVFETVQLMKGVLTHGSARATQATGLPLENFAGKTGTTNEAKDAWFAGFSPDLLTIVWVGYDEEEKVGIAGAGAALPIWIDYMRQARPFLTSTDFAVPDGLTKVVVDRGKSTIPGKCQDPQEEYLPPGAPAPPPCGPSATPAPVPAAAAAVPKPAH
jgi:penicillin-binding protein 1B